MSSDSTLGRIGRSMAPALFAASTVLTIFVAYVAPVGDLWRPLIVAVLIAVGVQVILAASLRDIGKGTYGASIVVLVLSQVYWLAGILLVLPAWWLAVGAMRRRSDRQPIGPFPMKPVSRAVAIVAVVFVLLPATRATLALSPLTSDPTPDSVSLPGQGGPDIFVLMLDGYPRADTLMSEFGYDNAPFLDALREEDFFVDDASESGYMKTWLSMSALLHMEHVASIPVFQDPPADPVAQHRLATRAILQAPFADALRTRGYEIVAGVSSFTETDLTTADRVFDAWQPTYFENAVMEETLLARAVDTIAPGSLARLQTDQARQNFADFTDVARETTDHPQFVLAHIEAPHTPFAVDAHGSPASMPPCYPVSCFAFDHYHDKLGWTVEEYGRHLTGYLQYINRLVLDAVAELVESRPEAVVIVMSDHGARFDPDDPQEHFRNLFAARTPGAANAYGTGTQLVNVFRQLSNAYFDSSFELLPAEAWFSDGRLLDLVPVNMAD